MPERKTVLNTVAVIGAGNMGSGIAQKTAQEGINVVMIDVKDEYVSRGLASIDSFLAEAVERRIFKPDRAEAIKGRIIGSSDLAAAAEADLVIEAVFEDEAVKNDLFRRLNGICKPEAVFATNTSSFSVTAMAARSGRPDRFVGLHFFYHPAKNRLLEIIPGAETSPETLALARKYARATAKTDILAADRPGFAVNRFFVPWLNEATRLLEQGEADIPTIEAAAKEAFKIGMGPFELMNVTGVPIAFHSATTLGRELGDFYKPSKILEKQAAQGEWDLSGPVDEGKKRVVAERLQAVVFLVACELVEEGVASMTDADIGAKVGLRWRMGPFEMINRLGLAGACGLMQSLVNLYPDRTLPEMAARQLKNGQSFDLKYVSLEKVDDIGWITFNRPEALNALNPIVVGQLDQAVEAAYADDGIRAIVIQGRGKAFVAGADIGFFVKCIKADQIDKVYDFTAYGQQVFNKLARPEKLTVAKLDGLSLGGGSELALACQVIVATEKAMMGFPETGIGIYPGLGGTQRPTRRCGPAVTRYLVSTGDTVRGEQLVEAGLADYFCPSAEVDETIKAMVASGRFRPGAPKDPAKSPLAQTAALFDSPEAVADLLAGKVEGELAAKLAKKMSFKAPVALRLANEIITQGAELDLEPALHLELDHLEEIFRTDDALIGLSSLGRGRPEFTGK